MIDASRNIDLEVVKGFGDEWARFDQTGMNADDELEMFNSYFDIFPWEKLPPNPVGFDLGCGSGRWAKLVSPRVGILHCIDPSKDALGVAKRNLSESKNCIFHLAASDNMPIDDESFDFGYSLGVLHHVPNTREALFDCAKKLKPGAPFLVYLYYRFDNRPSWFRLLWRITDFFRRCICIQPFAVRKLIAEVIAFSIYLPLARAAKFLEWVGLNTSHMPLSYYRNRSYYVLRTDALDRFGTRLEQRFTRNEIMKLMNDAGLVNVKFSEHAPFWCAVGYRKA